MNIPSRIKELRKIKKLSQAALAHACEWDHQSRISGYETGEREPSLTDLEAMCAAFGIDMSEFFNDGTAEPKASYQTGWTPKDQANKENDVSQGPENRGFVPVISWVQAGQWHEADDPFQPGYAEELIPCPKPHSLQTYALRVQGDSMTAPIGRSYPEGAIIYVDPELRGGAIVGDRVIAKLKNEDRVTFKQLARDGDKMYLKALNPNHPPIFDEFRILGKIIGSWIDG
ncbi:helix-turn-helix domain-containing protein [Zhongshania guokunii]|uniref:Helix-turn-helix domain-containing protein n=1 Tax=Zhongshania guokunii TaxID=641783 RepID=A0ABV3U751_9GAMM